MSQVCLTCSLVIDENAPAQARAFLGICSCVHTVKAVEGSVGISPKFTVPPEGDNIISIKLPDGSSKNYVVILILKMGSQNYIALQPVELAEVSEGSGFIMRMEEGHLVEIEDDVEFESIRTLISSIIENDLASKGV